jgi:hypothetical protein
MNLGFMHLKIIQKKISILCFFQFYMQIKKSNDFLTLVHKFIHFLYYCNTSDLVVHQVPPNVELVGTGGHPVV